MVRPFPPFFSPLSFVLCFLPSLVLCFLLLVDGTFADQKKKGSGGGGDLSDLLGGLDLDGMLSGVQEMLGKAGGGAADGKKGFDKIKEMAANLDPKMLQDMLGKIDTGKINEVIKNMMTPENMWNMLPANVKELLPHSWFLIGKKLGNVLAKEWDKIVELMDSVDKLGSAEELWTAVKQKTPMLADLLENDLWNGSKERWTKFEGNLGDEAKQYKENIKSTGWEWLSRKVFAPALRLSPEAKTNIKDSFGDTFPALKPLVEKAAANEKLKEWADQWKMMADLEAMMAQFQSAMGGMKTEEGEEEEEEAKSSNSTKTTTEEEMEKEEL